MNDSYIHNTHEKMRDYICKKERKNKRIYDNIMKSKSAQTLQEIAEKTEKDYGAPVKWNWFDQGILAKENIEEFNNVTYTCTYIIANIANLIAPIMPNSSLLIKDMLSGLFI